MSTSVDATATAAWTRLGALHDAMRPDLRAWFADDPGRAEAFSLTAGDLFVDLSKNLIDADVVAALLGLAEEVDLAGHRDAMLRGDKIKLTISRMDATA